MNLHLKVLKKIFYLLKYESRDDIRNWKKYSNKQYSNDLIFEFLSSPNPCMVARIGSTELLCLTNYLGVKNIPKNKYIKYIKGETFPWWWEKSCANQMRTHSGFFPETEANLEKFSELMLDDLKEIDVLGSWLKNEKYFFRNLSSAKQVILEDLEPFFCNNPWTKALENKKVLVVHPFSETIKNQYLKRKLLFKNNLLPDFQLITIQAVQSLDGVNDEYTDWFQALEYMKSEIDKVDYDICIIGCGAYGLPLAAHVKRTGKKAIHMAGVTQMLFGIKGHRWEQFIVWPYMNLFNENWVRPNVNEKPKSAQMVEGACYW